MMIMIILRHVMTLMSHRRNTRLLVVIISSSSSPRRVMLAANIILLANHTPIPIHAGILCRGSRSLATIIMTPMGLSRMITMGGIMLMMILSHAPHL